MTQKSTPPATAHNASNDITHRLYGNERKYVEEVLASEFRSSKPTSMTRRMETLFAEIIGSKFAISHVNGTCTMHSILEAIGVGVGDEVITTPLTMSATTFAILHAGATPIFADVNPDTFQIDAESIAARITPRTKAIITVALYGLSPDMDPIMALAKQHNLHVLEDNAECFLSTYKGRMLGTIGHSASFSFQSSKHITSGEGGMVTTDDPELADKIRKVQSLGYAGVGASKSKISKLDIQDPNYSRHVTMGWNYRMPELCAAVILGQLENVHPLVQRRIDCANLFDKVVRKTNWLVPQHVGREYVHSYWTYVVKLTHPDITWHQFRDAFHKNGGDGVYAAWKLTYLEPMFVDKKLAGRERFISDETYATYRRGLCPVAESLQPKLLQFKTGYWDFARAEQQAEILEKTIHELS